MSYIVGICGGSGSGKTSFIRRLRQSFSEDDVCIISQDDYYHPKELQPRDINGVENFDLPRSIDKRLLREHLEQLMAGHTIEKKEHVFNNEKAHAQLLVIKPAPIIVVEGLFVFHFKKVASLCDLKIFVNAKDNLKVIRRITRDRVERNYPLESVLYQYEHHVLPAFEKYILPYKDEADVVVNNNRDFEGGYALVEGFFRDKLKSLSA